MPPDKEPLNSGSQSLTSKIYYKPNYINESLIIKRKLLTHIDGHIEILSFGRIDFRTGSDTWFISAIIRGVDNDVRNNWRIFTIQRFFSFKFVDGLVGDIKVFAIAT